MTAFILNQWVPSDGCTCAGGNANAPVNTSLPVISGTVVVGQILTCSAGVWDGIPTTFLYQWQRDDTSISGAIHSTYTLVLADGLHAIRCVVSAINSFGATSTPSTAVSVPYPMPVNMSPPVVTGTAKVGATLTCWEGAWDNSPTSFTFQWQRNGTVSVGSGSTYVPIDADDGQSIRCIVTAFNSGGIVSATSNAVAITRFAPTNATAPIVTGIAFAGQTFTCTQGTWTNFPTTFAYQWQRDGTAISGATSSIYICAVADQGHALGCAVTASNSGGPTTANSNAIPIPIPFTFSTANLTALYSMRLVGAGYAGKCLNVRRTSDSATLDIGFDIFGNLDVAAAAAFAGTAQLTVAKWYDQSGAGLNLAQSSAAFQPQFNIINGKPWLAFTENNGGSGGMAMATATAPTLTGNQTIGFAGQLGSDLICMPIAQFDNTNGWFLTFNGGGVSGTVGDHPGVFQYFTTNGASAVKDTGRYFARTNRYAAKRSSGVGTVYVNGSQTATGTAANNPATAATLAIGANTAGGFFLTGLMGEVYVYAAALVDADRLAIDAAQASFFTDTGFSTPYSGTAAVEFATNEAIVCGNVLAYERTASWTAFAAVQLFNYPASATVIYTNVPGSGTAFPGHEMWVDSFGGVRIRIMNDINGNKFIGVATVPKVIDGKKHTIAYTYDGSSTAAGVKIYIDGVQVTTGVESDTLTASIVAAGQNLYVGNQQADTFGLAGTLAFFQIDNVVRSAAYIAANFSGGGIIPPVDANTDICLLLNEGSGTTAQDTSGHSRNGTLTSATMWI